MDDSVQAEFDPSLTVWDSAPESVTRYSFEKLSKDSIIANPRHSPSGTESYEYVK
jgi:hypothetical protein